MSTNPIQYFCRDRLSVEVHPDRKTLGRAAARAAAAFLHATITGQGSARVVFACAPSQDEFLAALIDPQICGFTLDWSRVEAFHMDDYVGLTMDNPRSFRSYLRDHLLQYVAVGKFHPLQAERPDWEMVALEYTTLLRDRPIDLICLGVGENGHIAFNDPPVADFADSKDVKAVELDQACRQQQVNDGCFPNITAVPSLALTLTVPVFRRARHLTVHVPGPRKAEAVRRTLEEPIATCCPASILRQHPHATLYLDNDSAGSLS